MTSDLDQLLGRLRDAPLDPEFEGMADKVFGRVALLRQFPPAAQLKAGVLAALGAGLLGVASSSAMPTQERDWPLTSFSANNPLAPSTLLLGVR